MSKLDEIRKALSEATPLTEPWRTSPDGSGGAYVFGPATGYDGEYLHAPDGELIVLLRNAAPDLLAAIEATECDATWMACDGRGIDLGLEPRHEFGGRLAFGPLVAGGRHQAAAQFSNDLLGDLGALIDRVEIQLR